MCRTYPLRASLEAVEAIFGDTFSNHSLKRRRTYDPKRTTMVRVKMLKLRPVQEAW